jgi:hypothetical protein
MGNKPLRRAFWVQLAGGQHRGPCRTCHHFVAWSPDQKSVRCDLGDWYTDPDEGCEEWQREPGSDDE